MPSRMLPATSLILPFTWSSLPSPSSSRSPVATPAVSFTRPLRLSSPPSRFFLSMVYASSRRVRWTPDAIAPSYGLAGGDLPGRDEDGLVRGENVLRVRLQPAPRLAPALQDAGDARPSVVGDQRAREVAVEAVHQLREVAGPELDVEHRIEQVRGPDLQRLRVLLQQPLRRGRHQLHEAAGADL